MRPARPIPARSGFFVSFTRASVMRAWSKCLIWIAAVLTPLQASQAMHLLCLQHADCSRNQEAATDPSNRECCCDEEMHRDTQISGNDISQLQPLAPGSCPPECSCRQSPNPLLPGQPPVEPNGLLGLTGQSMDTAPVALGMKHRSCPEADVFAALTAQQVCVSLCRFLV